MFRCLVHTSLQWSCKVDVIPSGFNEESLRALSGLHSREWRLADSLGTLLQSHIKLPDFSSDFINSKKMIISSMSIAVVGEVPSCPDYSAALTIYALECDDLFISSLHMLEIRLLTAKKSIRYHLKLSVLSICDIRDTLKFIWIFNLTEHLDYFVGWGWSPNLVHARWMLWLAAALCASFAQLLR